jgi:hypothetical protein
MPTLSRKEQQMQHSSPVTTCTSLISTIGTHPVPGIAATHGPDRCPPAPFVAASALDPLRHNAFDLRPASPQSLTWISRSPDWRSPETDLARSFVPVILAEAGITKPSQ